MSVVCNIFFPRRKRRDSDRSARMPTIKCCGGLWCRPPSCCLWDSGRSNDSKISSSPRSSSRDDCKITCKIQLSMRLPTLIWFGFACCSEAAGDIARKWSLCTAEMFSDKKKNNEYNKSQKLGQTPSTLDKFLLMFWFFNPIAKLQIR